MDEGYIKYQAHWHKTPPLSYPNAVDCLNYWRQDMYQKGLIGAYPSGIGFGNISQRLNAEHQFLISGSATGHFKKLTAAHYAKVISIDLPQNILYCEGKIIASSESMSHAVIYQECPEVHGVIHVHSLKLWQELLHRVPTTDCRATYGSPEMAYAIIRLLKTTDLLEQKIFVMEGHEEGIFVFGETLEQAAKVIDKYIF